MPHYLIRVDPSSPSRPERITIERRPLGTGSIVGNKLVRTHRRLGCPDCGAPIRSDDAREIPDGVALTCSHCHADVLTVERP